MTTQAEDIASLVERIKPLLAGKPPEVQGGALADLLAIWLAGNVVRGDPAATKKYRAELLQVHVSYVEELIPVNARMIGTDKG
jgi:hypothetical protein